MNGCMLNHELVTDITSRAHSNMDARFTSTTGKRVRLLRLDLDIKQGDLADTIGVRQSYLSEIEGDKASPSGEIIGKLAKELKTTADYLLLLVDKPEKPEDAQPTFLFDEAAQVAHMVDEMAYPEIREQTLRAVTTIYEHYQKHAQRDEQIRDLLKVIESTRGVEFRRDLERRLGLNGTPRESDDEPLSL